MNVNSLSAKNICRSPSIRSFINNYHQNLLSIRDLYQDDVYTHPTTGTSIETNLDQTTTIYFPDI